MSIYNGDNKKFLEESLQSIFAQTLSTDDVVVVCDGEINAELQEVLDRFKQKYPNIINQVQLPQNRGLGYALNFGLKMCKNQLVARMDSDDISFPERCKLQVEAFRQNLDLDICGTPVLEFMDNPDNIVSIRDVPKTHEQIMKFAKRRNPFNHPSVMFKKNSIIDVGGYADLRLCEDLELWIRLLSHGGRALNLENPLVYFRFNDSTYKRRKSKQQVQTFNAIYKRAYKSGFCSLKDYLITTTAQRLVKIMPIKFQKYLYKKHLRKKGDKKNG